MRGKAFKAWGGVLVSDKVFNRQKLILLLVELDVERMKAVFITEDGIFGYNLTSDGLTEVVLDDYFESRIELISDTIDDTFEEQLLSCLQE